MGDWRTLGNGRSLGLVVGLALVAGCLDASVTPCGDYVCPGSMVCDPVHMQCVQSSQLSSCIGAADGTLCEVAGAGGFHCSNEICIRGRCGDGVADADEQCDDGAGNADDVADACRTDCRIAYCGDGVLDVGAQEQCDDGLDNSDTRVDACRRNCVRARCGDGVEDTGELCDDGNNTPGDGCSSDCLSRETCGNGRVDAALGELCDDGGTAPGDGCGPTCLLEICGNDHLDPGEECDDGNVEANDGCSAGCWVEGCANGIVDPGTGEACDDGNTIDGDGCSANCLSDETCGNGVVDSVVGEVCDDGNTDAGDGCAANCLSDESCGTGAVDSWEECDDGNLRSHDGCSSGCTVETPTWTRVVPDMMRQWHAMAYDAARGVVVVFGGIDAGRAGRETWQLDNLGWTRLEPAIRPPARHGAVMAYDVIRQRIVLFGGSTGDTDLADTWEFDGTNWAVVTTAQAPSARRGASMVYDSARGLMVLFGGVSGSGSPVGTGDTWVYDGTSWVEEVPVVSPPARWRHAMAYDASRARVVLVGGNTSVSSGPSETWEYDGVTWVDRTAAVGAPAANQLLNRPTAAYDANRQLVVAAHFGITLEYDGASWQSHGTFDNWTESGGHIVYDSGAKRVLFFGGQYDSGTRTWDGASWMSGESPSGPPATRNHPMAYHPGRDQVFVVDGARSHLVYTWDDTGWSAGSEQFPPGGAGLFDAGLVYHDAIGLLVMFDTVGRTWHWDGDTSLQVTPVASPTPRPAYGFAYDAGRGRAVLFGGGAVGETKLGDTWEYDGSNWWPHAPSNAPAPRAHPAMAYDPDRGVVVLFGGDAPPGGQSYRDTWTWNGTDWSPLVTSTTPNGADAPAMVFDDMSRRIVLVVDDRTWELTDGDWVERTPGVAPAWRAQHRMAYDSEWRRVFLYGGDQVGSWGMLGDTWTYRWASAWPDEVCGNSVDDDTDGLEDCADPDCAYVSVCAP